jgi:hypothetical protein
MSLKGESLQMAVVAEENESILESKELNNQLISISIPETIP